MEKKLTDKEIRGILDNVSFEHDAVYTQYEAKVASMYNGCSDSNYSDLFLRKMWSKLNEIIYSGVESYDRVNVFCPTNLGAKALRYAPTQNTSIFALSNDKYCYIAAKAILQHIQFQWQPDVKWGCLADYYFVGKDFKKKGYDLAIVGYEADNPYYKSVDGNKKLTELPYYLYNLVRAAEFSNKLCVIVPNKYIDQLRAFKMEDYSIISQANIGKSIAEDANYTAILFNLK